MQTNLLIVIHFLVKALKPFVGKLQNVGGEQAAAEDALDRLKPALDCLLWDQTSFENDPHRIRSVTPIFMLAKLLMDNDLRDVPCRFFPEADVLREILTTDIAGVIATQTPEFKQLLQDIKEHGVAKTYYLSDVFSLLEALDFARVALFTEGHFEIPFEDRKVNVYNLHFYGIDFVDCADQLIPFLETVEEEYLRAFTSIPRQIDYPDPVDPPIGWSRLGDFVLKALHHVHRNQGFENFWIGCERVGTKNGVPESLFALEKAGHFTISKMRMSGLNTGRVEFFVEGLHTPEETEKQPAPAVEMENVFVFGNSRTDCEDHRIWKDGNKDNGQTF
ncbi:MAG: hypothetical protein QF793_03980, partial [Candidatus Peribacteraceae bacterium]|nr:hypothetical protein [Candidatus Peribacteraceae bacterium]